mmetsp:Transcript_4056/g.16980  ORF Transcript_4056/g.16980 Transcript_4056/m.16980 type:complete len:234 (+) Transcript_4056:1314-2015(+)
MLPKTTIAAAPRARQVPLRPATRQRAQAPRRRTRCRRPTLPPRSPTRFTEWPPRLRAALSRARLLQRSIWRAWLATSRVAEPLDIKVASLPGDAPLICWQSFPRRVMQQQSLARRLTRPLARPLTLLWRHRAQEGPALPDTLARAPILTAVQLPPPPLPVRRLPPTTTGRLPPPVLPPPLRSVLPLPWTWAVRSPGTEAAGGRWRGRRRGATLRPTPSRRPCVPWPGTGQGPL